MLTIRGICDGKEIKPSEEIPFKKSPKPSAAPIKVLRGCAKGTNLTEELLKSRKEDLELEEAKWGKR